MESSLTHPTLMALAGALPIFCSHNNYKPTSPEPQRPTAAEPPPDTTAKILLQPRVCTLRSFGTDRGGVIRPNREDRVPRFFEILSDYIESSKKIHDFEIISGRLAMIVFAATVGVEMVTGNSVFRKMDLLGIEEGGGACVAAIACAAVFAWFSRNRSRVGRMFTVRCNTFIDLIIDDIINGLFYDNDDDDCSH